MGSAYSDARLHSLPLHARVQSRGGEGRGEASPPNTPASPPKIFGTIVLNTVQHYSLYY